MCGGRSHLGASLITNTSHLLTDDIVMTHLVWLRCRRLSNAMSSFRKDHRGQRDNNDHVYFCVLVHIFEKQLHALSSCPSYFPNL